PRHARAIAPRHRAVARSSRAPARDASFRCRLRRRSRHRCPFPRARARRSCAGAPARHGGRRRVRDRVRHAPVVGRRTRLRSPRGGRSRPCLLGATSRRGVATGLLVGSEPSGTLAHGRNRRSTIAAMASDRAPPRGADPVSVLGRLARMPLVGRDSLFALLDGGLEEALGARGRTFLVAGEPGIGKTRIVEELIRTATQRGFVAHVSRCHEVQGAPALWPWARIARDVTAGRLAPDLLAELGIERRTLARLFPEAKGSAIGESPPAEGEETLFELFEAISQLLRRASRETPRLVVLEDVHWADPASLHLARFLGREVGEHRVVLVVTYRDTEVGAHDRLATPLADLAADAQLLQLEGLDEAATARLLAHAAGFEVPDVLAAAVHAQTGGNPLFATEVARMLAHEGRLGAPDEPTPEPVPLPATVRHVLARRLQRLSRPTADVLARASVLGGDLDPAVLERGAGALGRDALLGALDEARAARLVEPVPDDPTRLRFAHDLVRETIYESVGMAERARLHADVAAALRDAHAAQLDDHWGALARHLLLAGTPESALGAVECARRAGDVAARRASFDEAARKYEQALEALARATAGGAASDAGRTRCEILLALADVLWLAGHRSRARRHLREAAELARALGIPTLLARAAIGSVGRTDLALDVPQDAIALLEEALAAFPTGDDPLRVRMLADLARARYHGEERPRLVALAREAVAMAERLNDLASLFSALAS